MKLSNRLLAGGSILVLGVALSLPATFAQPRKGPGRAGPSPGFHAAGHGGFGMQRGFMGIFRALELTDAQKEQIRQIAAAYREQGAPLRQEIRTGHRELRQSFAEGSFDQALASERLTQLAHLEAELMGQHFNMRQEMLSVLTPEQLAKLEGIKEERRLRHPGQ
ncbi:MAG: Spy/CpxP family protein refolding chaperone [Acidobacteriota bacterium]